jgi:hypothetical protein
VGFVQSVREIWTLSLFWSNCSSFGSLGVYQFLGFFFLV